jgi:hypothetical protein
LGSIREIVEKILSFLNPGADGAGSGSGKADGPERPMVFESPSDEPEEELPASPDWENRVLCPDESCIGTIGPGGRCTECGRTGATAGRVISAPDEEWEAASVSGPPEAELAEAENERPEEDALEEDAPDDIDWEKRVLCPDESCIGAIGPDGRCTECGKTHPGFPERDENG